MRERVQRQAKVAAVERRKEMVHDLKRPAHVLDKDVGGTGEGRIVRLGRDDLVFGGEYRGCAYDGGACVLVLRTEVLGCLGLLKDRLGTVAF